MELYHITKHICKIRCTSYFLTVPYNPLGNLTEVTDWLGTTSIEYDKYGRMLEMTDHRGKSIVYEWGDRNEKKSILYPDGSKVQYDYDNLLRLKGL